MVSTLSLLFLNKLGNFCLTKKNIDSYEKSYSLATSEKGNYVYCKLWRSIVSFGFMKIIWIHENDKIVPCTDFIFGEYIRKIFHPSFVINFASQYRRVLDLNSMTTSVRFLFILGTFFLQNN